MSFNYDDDGVRVSKTVNGVTTHYVYNGNILISEYSDTETIVYIYDVNGSPLGFRYRYYTYADDVWDTYWYDRNLQGDIIAIYSANGTQLVNYKYDAWGNTSILYLNSALNTSAVKNNLTYRGYYYDRNLNLYYLQSRYYDAKICRFISPDSLMSGTNGSLHGFNLYVYCFNNPISYTDSEGNWPSLSEIYEQFKAAESSVDEFVENIKEIAYSAYYNATKWHFEDREENNGTHPSYSEVNEIDSGWYLLPESQSIYHDNGIGTPELKYITNDGREAVFDGDTLEPITDPRFIATYNYCPLYQITSNDSKIFDYLKLAASGVGHFFADMLPYYCTGNSNTREQFESKIFIFD